MSDVSRAACPACEYLAKAPGDAYIIKANPKSCQIISKHDRANGQEISRTFWVLRNAMETYDGVVEGTCDSDKYVSLTYVGGSESDAMYKLMIFDTKPVEEVLPEIDAPIQMEVPTLKNE
jgi:hypothetical protein